MGALVGPLVLKFTLAAGTLGFSANVNGHPARMVLDPTVSMSAISEDYAKRRHLHRIGHMEVRAGDTPVAVDTTGPAVVRMGIASFEIPRLAIAQLLDLSQTAGTADVILGADALDQATLEINFDHHQIKAVADKELREATRGFRLITLERGPGGERRMLMNIGEGPATDAILDLGAPLAVLMSNAELNTLNLERLRPNSTGVLATPDGLQSTVTFSLPAITVGGTVLNDVPTQAIANWHAPAPVILGLEVLEHYDIILDLRHDRLWLKPGSAKPFDRDVAGLTIAKRSGFLKVLHVAARSPAAAAGLKTGAVITAINGDQVNDTYFSSNAWRWRFTTPGKQILLTIDGVDVPLTTARFD